MVHIDINLYYSYSKIIKQNNMSFLMKILEKKIELLLPWSN